MLLPAIGDKQANASKRKILIAALAIGLLFVPLGSVLSFTAITGTNVITVTEPLKLISATTSNGTCTLGLPNTASFTFSCLSSTFAGESGTVTITIMNQASVPIVVTLTSSSNNTDVVVVNPGDTTLPQAQTSSVVYTYTLSQSAVPDSTTLNFMVTR